MRAAKAYRAILFSFCCVVAISSGALQARQVAAQPVAPAVYLGIGTGTNLGGTVGVGAEIRMGRYVATSAAVGVWPEAFRDPAVAGNAFDFDVGVKVYPTSRWIFAGLNYGIIHAEIPMTSADESLRLRKRRGFTFSLGLRTPAFHRFYLSSFAGITSDGDANHLTVFDRRTFMPHLGLMIGYELSSRR